MLNDTNNKYDDVVTMASMYYETSTKDHKDGMSK